MNKMNRFIFIVFMLIIGINQAWACGHPPPNPPKPPEVWVIDHGIDSSTGKSNMWFGVEIDPVLFPITEPTTCTCGIGIGGVGLPFIPSLSVTNAMIAVTNMVTHEITPLAGFDFTPEQDIADDAATNPLLPNQQWAGFSALVNNIGFTQPIFEQNEILKLWFNLEIDPGDKSILSAATENQLIGFSIGGDPSDILHAPQQFVGQKVPEPETAFIFALGLVFLCRRKLIRRS